MSALASSESDSGYAHVAYHVEDGVAHVRLNRPDKLNVLGFGPDGSRAEILAALQRADADASVGAILVSAEGRAFCAGGDLTGGRRPTDRTTSRRWLRRSTGSTPASEPSAGRSSRPCTACAWGAGLGLLAQFDRGRGRNPLGVDSQFTGSWLPTPTSMKEDQ
ncbi:1,4-dihydroxy-2-naphthoyl-CoA synthase [Streptomyces alboniger]